MRSQTKSWHMALQAGLLGAGIFAGGFRGCPPARVETPAAVRQAPSTDEVIEGLISKIQTSQSLPGWAASAAMNAYAVYKTYRNGQRVEDISANVVAILKEIANMKADADNSREMNLREHSLIRELLESSGSQLQTYESRLASLEKEMQILRTRAAPGPYRGGACQAEYLWSAKLGRCVYIAVAGRRR